MEKINGKNLYDYVNDLPFEELKEKKASEIFLDIINGVDYMHSLHISHHDLKTKNVVYDDEKEVAKVVDFGLSVMFQENDPFIKNNSGSPIYSAPEVLLSQSHDPSLSDVWSLGIILYYLLYRSYPWGNVQSLEELTSLITNENISIPYPTTRSRGIIYILGQILIVNPSLRISLGELKVLVEKEKMFLDDENPFSLPSPSKTGIIDN